MSLKNGHKLLLSLEMQIYDLVVFDNNSVFQKQQAINN